MSAVVLGLKRASHPCLLSTMYKPKHWLNSTNMSDKLHIHSTEMAIVDLMVPITQRIDHTCHRLKYTS